MAVKALGDKSSVLEIKFPAALFRRPVSGPSLQISSTISSIASGTLISHEIDFTEPPCRSINSFAVSSKTDFLLPQIYISAPSSKYLVAIAFPSPEPPPETKIRLLFSRFFSNILGSFNQFEII